ncbi:MAG TPA: hypothetical protein VFR11_01045 [Micromonosporaceae bacterium]|nr:hypothetical protein [Micromonosporaceae bacterium]
MALLEIAVWAEPGEPLLFGRVLKGVSTALVDWETGRQSTVKRNDPNVRFAVEGSRRLEWLSKPGLLEGQIKADPHGVIVDVIRDEGKPIQTRTIKMRLVELGLTPTHADALVTSAKSALAANRHVVIKGASHLWSEVPVDPFAGLRALPPHDALDRLLTTPRLKAGEKEALADAVRRALPTKTTP